MADLALEQLNFAVAATDLQGDGTQAQPFSGDHVLGVTANVDPPTAVDGIHASASASGHGVVGTGLKGVVGEGRSSNVVLPGGFVLGIGVEGSGDDYGVIGTGLSSDRYGVGVLGVGPRAGVTGFSQQGAAVYGNVNGPNTTLTALAGLFDGSVQVNGSLVVTQQKSAAVPFPDGTLHLLYAVESPECWFEDFGEAALHAGRATVALASDFARLIDSATYHVFLTPYGDSNGLYVARRGKRSFQVREQGGGHSDLDFSYRIVARRPDAPCERFATFTPLQLPNIAPPAPAPASTSRKRKRP